MSESRDPSRSSHIDWTGAWLAVLGLGGVVFALLEWPRPDANRPMALASMVGGAVSLAAFVAVERRGDAEQVSPRLLL